MSSTFVTAVHVCCQQTSAEIENKTKPNGKVFVLPERSTNKSEDSQLEN